MYSYNKQKLMKKLKQTYKSYKESYEMWEGDKYNYFKFAKDQIDQWFSNFKCKHFGHKWRCESDINPDSGSESMECTCCGESHSHTYY